MVIIKVELVNTFNVNIRVNKINIIYSVLFQNYIQNSRLKPVTVADLLVCVLTVFYGFLLNIYSL